MLFDSVTILLLYLFGICYNFVGCVEVQSLKDSSARPWSRCWEKWAHPRPWTRPSAPLFGHLLLLKPNKGNSLLLVLRYPIDTLITSVLNVPLFTTHVLLRLLWQSSPFSGILMQLTYSLTGCHLWYVNFAGHFCVIYICRYLFKLFYVIYEILYIYF